MKMKSIFSLICHKLNHVKCVSLNLNYSENDIIAVEQIRSVNKENLVITISVHAMRIH